MKICIQIALLLMVFCAESDASRLKRRDLRERPVFRYQKPINRTLELNDRLRSVLGMQQQNAEASIVVGNVNLPGDLTPRLGAVLKMVEKDHRNRDSSKTTVYFQRRDVQDVTPFQMHSAFGTMDVGHITYGYGKLEWHVSLNQAGEEHFFELLVRAPNGKQDKIRIPIWGWGASGAKIVYAKLQSPLVFTTLILTRDGKIETQVFHLLDGGASNRVFDLSIQGSDPLGEKKLREYQKIFVD